jgi:membrane fusion protein (multidrug efflux system)
MSHYNKAPGRRPLFGASLVFSALAILAGGCGKGEQGGPGQGGMPPAQVNVATVQPQTLPITLEYTGQTMGSREVEVRARVTGILLKRNYKEGGSVAAGQSLFTIDPVPFRNALNRAEADHAAVQARYAQAQRNAARLKPLFEVKAISQRDYDDAVSLEQVSAADLKAANARVTEAKLNLDYTRVTAPVSGLAGGAPKSEGSLISGPDVLLATIVQTNPIKAVFGVPDAESAAVQADVKSGKLVLPKEGFIVELTTAEGAPLVKGGRVQFSEPLVNATTGTVQSQAEIPNPGNVIKPGQFVRVKLTGATRPNVMQVPQRAVMEGPQGKFVYVVAPSDKPEMKGAEVATIRPVQAGEWVNLPDGKGWVIREGLKAGDRVITDGLMRIGPGAPVQVAAPAPAAGASAPGGAASGPAQPASK